MAANEVCIEINPRIGCYDGAEIDYMYDECRKEYIYEREKSAEFRFLKKGYKRREPKDVYNETMTIYDNISTDSEDDRFNRLNECVKKVLGEINGKPKNKLETKTNYEISQNLKNMGQPGNNNVHFDKMVEQDNNKPVNTSHLNENYFDMKESQTDNELDLKEKSQLSDNDESITINSISEYIRTLIDKIIQSKITNANKEMQVDRKVIEEAGGIIGDVIEQLLNLNLDDFTNDRSVANYISDEDKRYMNEEDALIVKSDMDQIAMETNVDETDIKTLIDLTTNRTKQHQQEGNKKRLVYKSDFVTGEKESNKKTLIIQDINSLISVYDRCKRTSENCGNLTQDKSDLNTYKMKKVFLAKERIENKWKKNKIKKKQMKSATDIDIYEQKKEEKKNAAFLYSSDSSEDISTYNTEKRTAKMRELCAKQKIIINKSVINRSAEFHDSDTTTIDTDSEVEDDDFKGDVKEKDRDSLNGYINDVIGNIWDEKVKKRIEHFNKLSEKDKTIDNEGKTMKLVAISEYIRNIVDNVVSIKGEENLHREVIRNVVDEIGNIMQNAIEEILLFKNIDITKEIYDKKKFRESQYSNLVRYVKPREPVENGSLKNEKENKFSDSFTPYIKPQNLTEEDDANNLSLVENSIRNHIDEEMIQNYPNLIRKLTEYEEGRGLGISLTNNRAKLTDLAGNVRTCEVSRQDNTTTDMSNIQKYLQNIVNEVSPSKKNTSKNENTKTNSANKKVENEEFIQIDYLQKSAKHDEYSLSAKQISFFTNSSISNNSNKNTDVDVFENYLRSIEGRGNIEIDDSSLRTDCGEDNMSSFDNDEEEEEDDLVFDADLLDEDSESIREETCKAYFNDMSLLDMRENIEWAEKGHVLNKVMKYQENADNKNTSDNVNNDEEIADNIENQNQNENRMKTIWTLINDVKCYAINQKNDEDLNVGVGTASTQKAIRDVAESYDDQDNEEIYKAFWEKHNETTIAKDEVEEMRNDEENASPTNSVKGEEVPIRNLDKDATIVEIDNEENVISDNDNNDKDNESNENKDEVYILTDRHHEQTNDVNERNPNNEQNTNVVQCDVQQNVLVLSDDLSQESDDHHEPAPTPAMDLQIPSSNDNDSNCSNTSASSESVNDSEGSVRQRTAPVTPKIENIESEKRNQMYQRIKQTKSQMIVDKAIENKPEGNSECMDINVNTNKPDKVKKDSFLQNLLQHDIESTKEETKPTNSNIKPIESESLNSIVNSEDPSKASHSSSYENIVEKFVNRIEKNMRMFSNKPLQDSNITNARNSGTSKSEQDTNDKSTNKQTRLDVYKKIAIASPFTNMDRCQNANYDSSPESKQCTTTIPQIENTKLNLDNDQIIDNDQIVNDTIQEKVNNEELSLSSDDENTSVKLGNIDNSSSINDEGKQAESKVKNRINSVQGRKERNDKNEKKTKNQSKISNKSKKMSSVNKGKANRKTSSDSNSSSNSDMSNDGKSISTNTNTDSGVVIDELNTTDRSLTESILEENKSLNESKQKNIKREKEKQEYIGKCRIRQLKLKKRVVSEQKQNTNKNDIDNTEHLVDDSNDKQDKKIKDRNCNISTNSNVENFINQGSECSDDSTKEDPLHSSTETCKEEESTKNSNVDNNSSNNLDINTLFLSSGSDSLSDDENSTYELCIKGDTDSGPSIDNSPREVTVNDNKPVKSVRFVLNHDELVRKACSDMFYTHVEDLIRQEEIIAEAMERHKVITLKIVEHSLFPTITYRREELEAIPRWRFGKL